MKNRGLVINYAIAILVGIVVGFKIIPPIVLATVYLGMLLVCGVYFMQGNIYKIFSLLPYIVFAEIFVRGHVRLLPYLAVPYLYIFGFAILLLKTKFKVKDFHFGGIIFLVFFFILEVVNGFFPLNLNFTRAIELNSLALLVTCIWASYYKFSPVLINRIMDRIRLATLFLAGIVLVAHLQGKIDYGGASNSDASNSMAPVQLSGYLGTGSILFLISILNPTDRRSKLIQSIFLIIVVTLMVLTFSRGGLYFLAIVTMSYLFFNRSNLKNYFKFLIFLPIGLIVYNFVVQETGGKIVERYEAKGASNREGLVMIGIFIFTEHPVIGIGTGNYNTYIKRNKLFPVESGVHNEFIRVAAEHGVIGIFFYWGFFIALLVTIFRRQNPTKQYAFYFFILFFLITIHNGLKISVQPLVLLLSIAIAPLDTKYKRMTNVSVKQQRA